MNETVKEQLIELSSPASQAIPIPGHTLADDNVQRMKDGNRGYLGHRL